MNYNGRMRNVRPVFNNTIVHNNNRLSPRRRADGTEIPMWEWDYITMVTNKAVMAALWNAVEQSDSPKCHPETRVLIHDGLVVWSGDPNGGPVKLISGWAGTGKTTISRTLADYWTDQGLLLATFFFSRSSQETSDVSQFPETILYQILRKLDIRLPMDVLRGKTLVHWEDVVRILQHAPPLSKPMIIVIDGLDECRQINMQEVLLIQILKSVPRLGPFIKILISCRPEHYLERHFKTFTDMLGSSYRITLGESPADEHDIRARSFAFLLIGYAEIIGTMVSFPSPKGCGHPLNRSMSW